MIHVAKTMSETTHLGLVNIPPLEILIWAMLSGIVLPAKNIWLGGQLQITLWNLGTLYDSNESLQICETQQKTGPTPMTC